MIHLGKATCHQPTIKTIPRDLDQLIEYYPLSYRQYMIWILERLASFGSSHRIAFVIPSLAGQTKSSDLISSGSFFKWMDGWVRSTQRLSF
ncbi:hypothetical protein TNIN_224581 [Trichonephila inaurata madagascariensis]|uniref:Uncharacterized protein n=1 Tax=Trichonephila inaurata madagascariensis TaxID=2747483 RepID=A0A8X6YDQ4_9ARAC|nr:hypothetical protein TNIN_224581 [Trichonephila inaurata madagascariensis]